MRESPALKSDKYRLNVGAHNFQRELAARFGAQMEIVVVFARQRLGRRRQPIDFSGDPHGFVRCESRRSVLEESHPKSL